MCKGINGQDSRLTSQKGTRCHICTGCGNCFHHDNGIKVITESYLKTEWEKDLPSMKRYLVAVDIGTTTIAMVLYGEGGRELQRFVKVNPQTSYGADVISRIQASENLENAQNMHDSVLQVLEKGLEYFQDKIKIQKESLYMVVAANTTMVYLLMGWDTGELGRAPFHASHLEITYTKVSKVPTVILPGLSAFVGGDIVAGIYACGMAESENITLLVDLGTNGEIVLGNCNKIIACATAAGPAFEGGATKGIWGADMVSLTARLLREGIVDETGLLAEPYFEDGILIGNTLFTQQALRALQMAKGAIAAGIDILIEQYGLEESKQIDRVILAGGFGYFLKAEDASTIGLFPRELKDKVQAGGNVALRGALRFGKTTLEGEMESMQKERQLHRIKKITSIINLAEIELFNKRYLESMFLCVR